MRAPFSKTTWLAAVAAAGMMLACATTSSARSPRVVAEAKEKKKKKKKKKKEKKIIKILRAGKHGHGTGCCFGEMKKRGFLGVHLSELNPELRAHFGAPKDAGVLVSKVVKDSPAEKAGMKVGDVLTAVDGEKVASQWEAVRRIGKKKKDEKAKLTVVRGGTKRELVATIQEREKHQLEVSKWVHALPGGDEEIKIMVDTGDLEEYMDAAREHLEDFDIDFESGPFQKYKFFHQGSEELEKRVKELEEKIKKLEEKLQGRLTKSGTRRST